MRSRRGLAGLVLGLVTGLAVAPVSAAFSPDALDVAGRLEEHGLTVRPFPWEGIRITVGPAEANNLVLDVLT